MLGVERLMTDTSCSPKADVYEMGSPMRNTFTVYHNEHVSSRPFEEVINAFESAVGSVEDTGFPALLASTKSAEEFESSVQSREGTSGFMRFLTVNHRAWLARIGLNAKARVYTI